MEGAQNFLKQDFLEFIVDTWYVSLPIGVFLVLAAKYVEKLAIFLAGFVLGIVVVFPLVEKYVYSFPSNTPLRLVVMIVVGVLTAAICYAFYRSFVFILGALLGFAISYYLFNFISNMLKLDGKINSQYITWGILVASLLVAVWGGFTALKKEAEMVKLFSILTGAALTSFVTLSLLWERWKGSASGLETDWKFLLPFVVLFLILVFIGMKVGEKRSTGE